jgi:hypothetical protein
VAIAAWELVSQLRVRSPFRWRPVVFHPVILGFALGTALFWAWGLSVSVSAFIQDHFRDHLLDRLTHDNRLGYAGYPTPLALWLEFLRHTGILLVPIGCWLLVSDLRRRTAAFLAFPRGIVLVWIGLLAVAFTMVDWRMTKHLIPMVLPISLAFAQGRQLSRQRLVLTVVVLFVAFVSNVWSVRTLATSFESFIVTPAW